MRFAALVLCLQLAAPVLSAEEPVAVVTYAPSRTLLGPGDETRIDLLIEIPQGQAHPYCPGSPPLLLAGYQIAWSFDPIALELVGGAVCPDTPEDFSRAAFTNAPLANALGGAMAVAAAPVPVYRPGRLCYATIRLRARPLARGSSPVTFGFHPVLGRTHLASIAPHCGAFAISHNDSVVTLQLGPSGAPPAGDLNLDGVNDVLDLVTLASGLAGVTPSGSMPFRAGPSAADLNGDKTVDARDLEVLAGKVVEGPAR